MNGRVTHLQLSLRGLVGVISSSISSLIMLTHLNLSSNNLHGPLGEEIYGLTNLIVLDLSSNSISGSIPQEIGKLLSLQKLHLSGNNLMGPFPSSLMNCTNLVEISLRNNHLNGDISKLDFSRLAQLQKLDLRDNSLNGTIPESIYSCKSLIAIGLSRNAIMGQISPNIVELKSLSFFSITRNSLTNITSTLRALAKCKNLTSLFLSKNFFDESLPNSRNFIGVGEFAKLQFFYLDNCQFAAGPIPNWLSNMKRLQSLSLQGNGMTGRIPNWLGALPSLSRLQLNNNSLFGELPLILCQLPALISQNGQEPNPFKFEMPVFDAMLVDTILGVNTYIRVRENYYHGLDLSYNAFSGDIPEEIGSLQNLQELDLSHNHFSGHIPASISNLRMVEVLNLSANRLTGEIPTSLARLSFLSHFDVSYNDLEGPIPTGGQLSTFDESSFEGNPGLFGEPLNHPCSNSTALGAIDHITQPFVDGLVVGLASGFSGALIVIASHVWLNHSKRGRPASFLKKKITRLVQ